jgi:dipeptidyl aminopeptidase/acylaminoacyl peptidase
LFWVKLSVGPRGEIAFTGTEPQHPTELYYLRNVNAAPTRLTDFNADIGSLELGKTETIEWAGPDGYHEDGVLIYPPDFSRDRKYPLVLFIHGGPPAPSKATFSTFPPIAHLMAAQGWVVFQPNYRGSDNLGNKYQAAISNDAGDGPGRDVMAGLEEVKKRGFVDESKIAVTGWSYGGFMTIWLLGHYGGWKAAIAGAAVTDWVDQYDLSDFNLRVADGFGPPGVTLHGKSHEDVRRAIAHNIYQQNYNSDAHPVGYRRLPRAHHAAIPALPRLERSRCNHTVHCISRPRPSPI